LTKGQSCKVPKVAKCQSCKIPNLLSAEVAKC
jgi:hypothetical protein